MAAAKNSFRAALWVVVNMQYTLVFKYTTVLKPECMYCTVLYMYSTVLTGILYLYTHNISNHHLN